MQKLILVKTSLLISIAAIIWGGIYFYYGQTTAGLIPITYAVLSLLSLIVLKISNIFELFRFSQIFLILVLPFLLMLSLGGFVNGSVVILWALLAPIGALLSGQVKQALYWFIAFNFLVISSSFVQPYLNVQCNLPPQVINFFFVINIFTVTLIIFIVLNYFVKHKDKVIKLIQKNRELEDDQLEKELLLRESDKLATLGRLSAGIAHELNNPATVALRGSVSLRQTLTDFEEQVYKLGQLQLSNEELKKYNQLKEQIKIRSNQQHQIGALQKSDNEDQITEWLESLHIDNASKIASMLANLNFDIDTLKPLLAGFSKTKVPSILSSLDVIYSKNNLLDEIEKGSQRITEIVKSLKSYSYQEEAPLQTLDIHDGLNDTFIILRNQLKKGVDVKLKYGKDLPRIQARSNELIQVWTNIIDNAVSAMKGKGILEVKTFKKNDWLIVQISDTGACIPEDVKNRIFDPFFTTKPPGEGTGLGLNISYDIIVNRHHGSIDVFSKPGKTCFEIRLPVISKTEK